MSIKSSVKNRVETLINSSSNCFSSHAGKVKILRSHCEKLCSELDTQYFDDSWKEEVSNLVQLFETCLRDSHSNGMLDKAITLGEVIYVVKDVKNNTSARSDGIAGELIKYGENLCVK